MRLVHYYPRALVGDGGPTVVMWSWATALKGAGYDVIVLYDGNLRDRSPLVDPSVRVVPVRHVNLGLLSVPLSLRGVLEKGDVLILHSGYVPVNTFAAIQAHRVGVPYVVVPHGAYQAEARIRSRRRKWMWNFIERPYTRQALGVHLFLEAERSDLDEFSGARPIIAPTGLEMPQEEWDGGSGGYLAWLGRYDVEHKGLDLLLGGLALLPPRERMPLRLHGRDSKQTRGEVKSLAARVGVSDWVEVGGPISGSAKRQFLRRSLAFVNSSRWESYGMALLESVALGVPTVATNGASISRSLEARRAAVVVNATPSGLCAGIRRATAPDTSRELGRRGRDFVESELNWEKATRSFTREILDRL